MEYFSRSANHNVGALCVLNLLNTMVCSEVIYLHACTGLRSWNANPDVKDQEVGSNFD